MTNLSGIIKNGQQIKVTAGGGAINVNDLVSIGGPGNQAWSIGCADYAANSQSGPIANAATVVTAALPASSRQPVARDRFGNVYIAGTNSSGRLVAYKYSTFGNLINTGVLDNTVASVNNPILFQLQNGTFACVYAGAAGALAFVIFDAGLSIVSGPASVATEYASTNVVQHSACALSGGGFAIVYQTSGANAINFVTYANNGTVVQNAVNIQTLSGATAQMFLRIGQLSNGNMLVSFRGTMTAGSNAGTSFVITSVAGVVQTGPTNVDSVATAGWLEQNIMTGFFAVGASNGTNTFAAIYTNAGLISGTKYSVGNVLNNSYPQIKITNDGVQFWVVWFSSVANGVYVIPIATSGATGTAASALAGSIFSANTYALDATITNGIMGLLVASTTTNGQYIMSIGLPDSSQGVIVPYIRLVPTAVGAAAGTTGSFGPRVMGGGEGFYTGSSPPLGQPTNAPNNGDWTMIYIYDQQNTAGTFLGIQKLETSAVVGIAQTAVNASAPGSTIQVNPGQGEYFINAVGGTSGTSFNHLSGVPGGCQGYIYPDGVALSGLASSVSSGGGGGGSSGSTAPGIGQDYYGGIVPTGYLLSYGQPVSRSLFAALFAAIGTQYGAGDGSTTFNLPDKRGRVTAGLDNMGGTPANRLTNFAMSPNGNTLGATGGAQSIAASLALSGSASVSVSVFGSVVSGNDNQGSQSYGALPGGNVNNFPQEPHNHTVSLTSSGSGSGSISGTASGTLNVVQPTILANALIKT